MSNTVGLIVTATIARTGQDAYTVVFDGMRSEGVTRAQLTRVFHDLPDIGIGHEVVARWRPPSLAEGQKETAAGCSREHE